MKYDYDKLEEIVTERLENIDLNEVAKFLSKSVDAIWYRDTFLTAEFNDWLETFYNGERGEDAVPADYKIGTTFDVMSWDLAQEIAEKFIYPTGTYEDGELSLEDTKCELFSMELGEELFEILPDALELTRTMNNANASKEVA